MYASIRRYGTSDYDEVVRRAQEGFAPIVKQVPGFQAYYFVNSGDGTLTTITIADDQSGVEESATRAREWVAENAAELVEGTPEITNGEVSFSA